MGSFEIDIDDAGYPEHLRVIPDPPKKLYGKGSIESLCLGLAVIGARRATPYGLSVAEMLAGWAAASGYVIISGGAHGCDQAAHRAALDSGGRTVAVMAGGADIVYPSGATVLHSRIVESGGAIVSEHPWGTRPLRWMFRKRNRIIAGLSAAVLIVEAGLPSGTFSTADDALAGGRDVLAVPGSILSAESRGSNRLISQGASVITDVSDLAAALRNSIGEPQSQVLGLPVCDASEQDPLMRALKARAMRAEDVAYALGADVVTVMQRLGSLESRGLVVRYQDGRYGPRAPT
jgi:DNA processing protein